MRIRTPNTSSIQGENPTDRPETSPAVPPLSQLVRGSRGTGDHPALARLARTGQLRIVLGFGGQAQRWWEDLEGLYRGGRESREVVECCSRAMVDELDHGLGLLGLHPLGLDLEAWLRDPSIRPSDQALAGSAISQPAIFVTQAARLQALRTVGLAPEAISEWAVAVTGHSQGIVAAALAAEGLPPAAFLRRAARIARYMAWQGARMQIAWGRQRNGRAPMLAVSGLDAGWVEAAVGEQQGVTLALVNGPRQVVLSGEPDALVRMERWLAAWIDRQRVAFSNGTGSPPPHVSIEGLPVGAPFHSPVMEPCLEALRADADRIGAQLDPAGLVVPLLRYEDGAPWLGEPDLVSSQCLGRVDWLATMDAVRGLGATYLVDLGPGGGVASLCRRCLEGWGVRVVAGATEEGQAELRARDESSIRSPRPWGSWAPVTYAGADGGERVENAFTRLTGAPPVLLPGMTPTTVEAPIVAAAANAGFLAELAGGGQPSEAILRDRAEQLRRQLQPGEGYLFNALYLDRYLWDLHLGEKRLVQRLRAEGHPILGVTITAGLPPVDEAAALLRELRGLGMELNALKVGADDQIEQALAIADRDPGHPLILQIEGGRAGGHHGFAELEELLLRWYGRIRQRLGLVLAVGGGIADPERAWSLLSGTWSEARGRAPMPVDAVFVGTAAMAALEAGTSPAVKRALVAARGSERLMARGTVAGSVRSGCSGLGADIHYLDNHAARTAALLDAVAGDVEAVRARHDEIAAALSRSCKPWFGDLEDFDYLALLQRLVDLMALGRRRSQDDGPWLDPTHRGRFLRMLRRALRRCHWSGPWPHAGDLDEPHSLLTTFAHLLPALAETPVLPEDARFFVIEVCGGPGKPVPFVPIIDENVRRWFTSDALWQSHDDRYDAESVLVVPGPGGLDGVQRVDEPVADLLARFLQPCLAGAERVRDGAWSPGQAALGAQRCLRGDQVRDNPLPAVLSAGGGRSRLVPSGSEGVRLELEHPLPEGPPVRLALPFELRPGRRVELRAGTEVGERLRSFYRELLLRDEGFGVERVAAWRRVVGDDAAEEPLQLAFALALPAMMRALLSGALGADPTSLLHVEGQLERLATPGSGPVEVRVSEPEVADRPGGREVLLRAELCRDGRADTRIVQRFLLRHVEAPLPADACALGPVEEPTAGAVPIDRPRSVLDEDLEAPVDMAAFAAASGDLNPIHRDACVAALAGLDAPIVHGQWMASAACARLTAGGRRLRWVRVRYLDTVPLGARLRCLARAVARVDGDEVVELELSHDERPVLALTALMAAPATALVFPGQGCQRPGIGMEGYARSAAARAVWDRAERHARRCLGFSLLEAVRDNPRELDVAGEVLRHPEGVLNATQITQVALAVMACAGVAELREAGALPKPRFLCGHSVGEYSALSALGGVVELEDMVELVFQRGATMQHFVDRDADGRSPFAMGVVRPGRVGLDGAATAALVEEVARRSGQPLFVVNHNVRDKQYAVAGHVEATAALEAALAERGEGGWVALPGLDVPFHSPLLRQGVPAFRDVLEQCVPVDLDLEALEGHYLPNLVARPFRLDEDFVQAVIEATGTTVLEDALVDPRAHGRTLLIEVLAWQFASPVRWIETQELLLAGCERLLELGPGEAPVLVGMMARSQQGADTPLELVHGERDREILLGLGPEPVEPAHEVKSAAADTMALVDRPAVSVSEAPTLDDSPLSFDRSVRLCLSVATGRPLADFEGTASLDGLLSGNSARRNQVLAALGKELGVSAVDGAHELPMPALVQALEAAAGSRYRLPGPFIRAHRDRALAELGLDSRKLEADLYAGWGLGPARQNAVLCVLPLVHREESGLTGDQAVEAAVARYATLLGREIPRREAPASNLGVAMDPRALEELGREDRERWAGVARTALQAAGLDPALVDRAPVEPARPAAAVPSSGLFDSRHHVALTASASWARADALRWYARLSAGEHDPDLEARLVRCASPELVGVLEALIERARRQKRPAARRALERCTMRVRRGGAPKPWAGETAVITGAGPGSIAEAVVVRLLEGGARVVATTFPPAEERRQSLARFRALYRQHAAAGAELHLVPFDQGCPADAEALCHWLVSSASEERGARRQRTKEPWLPTLCFPFAAAPAEGDVGDLGERIRATLQVNLVGVERLVGAMARYTARAGRRAPRVHVVLPLSPNHGQVGRDGLYAESKAGLEALLHRWRSEWDRWGHRVTLVGARMGWVRGTGLMGGLDPTWQAVETELGIQTFDTIEMADLLLERCQGEARGRAAEEPVVADLTGGFGAAASGLREVIERALRAARRADPGGEEGDSPAPLPRLLFDFPTLPATDPNARCGLDPSRAVAIVGFGEVGPFGNERVRWSYERHGHATPEAALELAWLCGLVRFERGRWEDRATGEAVDPSEMADRYDLDARVGVRRLDHFAPGGVEALTELRLEQDLIFHLPDETLARSIAAADPDDTEVFQDAEGRWTLRCRAGSRVRLPRLAPLTRTFGGQLPDGWDLTRLGLDADLVEQMDPVAAFNLVATAEAFRSAGAGPEELCAALHPTRVGSSQGGGIGGMRAIRRLYVDPVLDRERQTDALQEALINVSPAWAACALHGGYGPMVHPVGACATAAVSLELGVDMVLRGKADLVVAGAFDDLGPEGMRGFADMGATISDRELESRGLEPDQASRPCDARRGGFVEAQGGGTLLLCRADRALELGLPIYGLVGGAWSRGDGLQGSIPAPGKGLLGLAAGGERSPLARSLAAFGLGPGDIGVVSLHGTSTEANDPNEVDLHASIAMALGRDLRDPLPVIAQKGLTGHSKGGAAAWQSIGLVQAMLEGVVPAIRNLDEPDAALARRLPLCFPDEPLELGSGELRAALLTSLGFGHVGALVCLVHPDVLLTSLPAERLEAYSQRRERRWRSRLQEQHRVLLGEQPAVQLRGGDGVSGAKERDLLLNAPVGEVGP